MTRLLSLTFMFLFSSTSLADCNTADSSTVLGAVYKVSKNLAGNKKKHSQTINFWRNKKQVAHEYPARNITEIWELTRKGTLRLERHFDEHKRGIEYQPNEINHGKGEKDWSLKYQLISNKLKDRMKLVKTSGSRCNPVENYVLKEKGSRVKLEWLAKQKLINKFQVITPAGTTEWIRVETIPDPEKVKQVFTSRRNYQTTDYTDIGDNESDPFLLKMINLGFVEHGASGFYDAAGHRMERKHQH